MKLFSHATVARRLTLGFGLMLVILAAVAVMAMLKVQTIDAALRANSEQNALIQRYAINFRGSAHDRAIAIRDVVLAATPADGERERATIQQLAEFYANSAGPLEKLVRSARRGTRNWRAFTPASRPSRPAPWPPPSASLPACLKATPQPPGSCCGRRPSRNTCNGWPP